MPDSLDDYPPYLEVRSRQAGNLPRLLYLTEADAPLHTLARLFLHGVPVELRRVREAIRPMSIEEWTEAGLLMADGELVRARVTLYPFQGLALAMDLPELLEQGAPADFVSGVTNSTAALASFMIGSPCRSVLDLGTGCGVLGLLAARRGGWVLGSDVNPRALAFARFNARLNGITNIEFAEGSTFEPAVGRKFDLIIANPPCIIGPGARYTFRDSGMELDGLCHKIIGEAPRFLEDGGILQSTVEWPDFGGVDWRERMSEWFEGSGCDTLVLRATTRDALAHAEDTVAHTESAALQAQQLAAFAEYFGNRGVVSVSDGFIMMRRRASSGPNWVEFEELPERRLQPFGDAALNFFEAQDRLAAMDQNGLLRSRPRLAAGSTLESSHEWDGAQWEPGSFTLRQNFGLRLFAEVDANVATLARLCDGSRDLGELLAEMAAELDADLDALAPVYLGIVRHMISRGFLLLGE